MRIDIRSIAKQAGSSMDLKLRFNSADIDISPDECDIDGPIGFEGTVMVRDAKTCLLAGRIKAYVRSNCGRCGEQVVFDPEAEVKAVYRITERSRRNDLADESEETYETADVYSFDGISIIPDEAFRDSLLLSVPAKILCSRECKGLCAYCGKNLNEGPCDCSNQ